MCTKRSKIEYETIFDRQRKEKKSLVVESISLNFHF